MSRDKWRRRSSYWQLIKKIYIVTQLINFALYSYIVFCIAIQKSIDFTQLLIYKINNYRVSCFTAISTRSADIELAYAFVSVV